MKKRKLLILLVSLGVILAFSSTGLATLADLSDAMSDLTDHINGTTPLTGPEIETRIATIEANNDFMDDNTTIMTEAFDLSNLYETVVGPLFINAETSGGFPREQTGSDGYELERAIFLVEQTIIDVIYTPANCQTYQSFLDGRKFETADFFPGACAPPVDPQVSYNVNINGSNATMWGKPVCYGPIPARRPTGVYLAPGSIGEVTVPPAIVNQGFEILVGAHTVDKYAYYKGTLLRLDRVTKSFPITSTVTKIANPLGGGVYIMVPYEVYFGTQTVSIKNVVQAPYFAATSTNQTTLQQWTDTERHHPGPWADFESEKFMMTLPTSWIYNYADPVTQMQDWDVAMDAVSELLGWIPPYNVRNLPVLYVEPDRSIQHGAYGTGYPQINTIYNPDSPTNGNSNHFFLTDVLGWSTTYHELGHCQLFSKFPGHTEATVNLPFVYVAEQKFGWDQTTALTESMNLAYLENMSVDQTALTWFVTENFRNGNPMDITNSTKNEVRYQHRGYGRYVDMANLYGWQVLIDFYYQEHLDYISPPPSDGLTAVDSRIFRLSKAAGYDLTALIHCWGVHPEDLPALQQAITNEGLPKSDLLRDRLIYYKSIIPADNAEFWDHYTTIYPSQPEGGHPDYQYGWYNVWKYIYDETHGTAAKNAMQDIIDLYFDPDTEPPSPDPMTWASVPQPVSDSSITMTATVATDALNDVEYYFTCVAGGGHDSGWQSSNSYTDTGLETLTEYTYTVTARDTSNNHNETAPSTAESATTYADTGAPTPDPATFAALPMAVSDTEIVMAATIGVDGSTPVEYYFDETSGNPGGTDSGWTTDPIYIDTGLDPDTQYTYTVQMRDAVLNTGGVSAPASTTTPLAGIVSVTVPNGDFETIYKQGSTTITAYISGVGGTGGGWTQGVGPACPIDSGQYNFSDLTTDTIADIPGWVGYDRDGWIAWGGTYGRDQTTGNLQGSVSTGNNHTPGGVHCYLANGASWGNPAGGLIVSDASLGNIQSEATYVLSMYANGSATPIVLKLLADGVEIVPTSSVDPTLSGTHQEFIRIYDVGDLTGYVGQAITIVCGLGRDAVSTQCHVDDVTLGYYAYGAPSDTDPPTPDPATFASPPAADSSSAISMTATTGSDATGPVEYYFDETSGNPGGTDSGWQTIPTYTDSGLSPSTQYTYTVQMRDALSNTGGVSTPANATTLPAAGSGTGLKGDYYDNMDFTAFVLSRTDSTVNFDWGAGSPDPSIGADTFSARWTGQVEPMFYETYTFKTTSDDGVRLWVNGQQIIDNWTDHAPTDNTGNIALSAGVKYDITLEYYENGGGAVIKLYWSSASQVEEIIPQTQLYPAVGDTNPPTPDPATFAVAPTADSSSAISMTATTGSDPTGPVQYYFDETSGNPGGTDSGWQISPSYTDSGLSPSTQYTYTVTMRDSVTPTPNMGTPSSPANATTQAPPDTDPPTPNPATWAVPPTADSSSSISMTATTGSDATNPVEYFFDETSGNPGGSDSGWQTSPSYIDGGLNPGTQYTYTVTMRDSVTPTPNVGTASNPASATTPGGPTVDDFNVSEDAYVKQKKPTTNYGDASVLRVRSSSTKQIDSYLKFSVSGVGTVTSAKLKLWSIDVNMGVDVYQAASNSWSEGSIIWNTAPGTTGGVLDSLTVTTGWTEFDVTSAISGDGTYSFVLQGDTDAPGRDFSSSEGSYVPVLTITHQ